MKPRDLQDDPMPDNWSAELDNDSRWRGMAALLKESDRPPLPSEEDYERICRSVKETLEEERSGVVRLRDRNRTADAESFGSWVRQVVFGGGPAAQLVRFAAVAGLAFWGGMQSLDLGGRKAPDNGYREATTVASAPAEVSPVTTTSVKNDDPGVMVQALPQWEAFPGELGVIDRSGVDETGSLKTMANAGDPGWRSTASPSGQWNNAAAVTVSNGPATGDSAQRQALQTLQEARFHAMMSQDGALLDQVRRLEQAFDPLLVTSSGASGSDGNATAQESFRRGEELLAGERTSDALLAFGEVRTVAPGSFIAFLAQLQIARIDYDVLHDYQSASEAYRVALEEYPAHFITPAHKEHIVERLDMLNRNSRNGWQAVRLWEDAQSSQGAARVSVLEQLIHEVPQAPLAGTAARQLAAMSTNYDAAGIDPARLVQLFDEVLAYSPAVPSAAEVQFAKGEVLLRRQLDLPAARAEFAKVGSLPGGVTLENIVASRMEFIKRRTGE